MVYKLNVTEHADELLDKLVYHLIYRLENDQAAKQLLDCIDVIYDRLEVNPFQFAECRDAYLSKKGYREAVVPQMNYIIIFDVRADVLVGNLMAVRHNDEGEFTTILAEDIPIIEKHLIPLNLQSLMDYAEEEQ